MPTEIIELTKLAAPKREQTKCVPQRRPSTIALVDPTSVALCEATSDATRAAVPVEPTSDAHQRTAPVAGPTNDAHQRTQPANDEQPRRPVFGEFLVEQRVLDRYQLFRVLQLQDRMPGARLGHCAVALGYAPRSEIEQLHVRFVQSDEVHVEDIDLESMTTDAFERDPELYIQYRDLPR